MKKIKSTTEQFPNTRPSVHTRTHASTRARTHAPARTHAHKHTRTHARTHPRMHARTHTHTQTHTHTHTLRLIMTDQTQIVPSAANSMQSVAIINGHQFTSQYAAGGHLGVSLLLNMQSVATSICFTNRNRETAILTVMHCQFCCFRF